MNSSKNFRVRYLFFEKLFTKHILCNLSHRKHLTRLTLVCVSAQSIAQAKAEYIEFVIHR